MAEKVLVTAAYKGELDRLGSLPSGWVASPCGIGGVAAAAGLAMLLTVHAPNRIIVLGTCGALGRGLTVGSLVTPRTVRWVDPSVLAGMAHMPGNVYKTLQVSPWPNLPVVTCLQTPSLTLATESANRLSSLGQSGVPTVEHLELYSMAFVAHSFGVPLTAVLGVTNPVGPTGHTDWVANHQKVEAAIQDLILRQFGNPAAERRQAPEVTTTNGAPPPPESPPRRRWLADSN